MVLTVTLNPLLERRFSYGNIDLESVNRDGKLNIQAGGKGINVSRQLNCLKVPNIALTFLGGSSGRVFKESLEHEKINFTSIRTSSGTREASILIDEKKLKVYSFFSADQEMAETEVEEFMVKLEKMIQNCEIVVFSGSSPSKSADVIFPFGIDTANKHDKISVCDTYGSHLKECIKRSPTILHNNVKEIKDSLKLNIDAEEDKINLMKDLYNKGIKQVYLTEGPRESYASNFDFHYKVVNAEVKEIDPAGSGDSFTAGIVYGWHHDLTFEESLIIASSLGSVNACKFETSKVNFEEIEEIKSFIRILPLGKKMKLIDVTPI